MADIVQPPKPIGTEVPETLPVQSEVAMPKFMRMLSAQPADTVPAPPVVAKPEDLSKADLMYRYLWPIIGWSVGLFNIAIMGCTMFSMVNNYSGIVHAQVSGITLLSFAALTVIYKWILGAPDRLMPSPGHPKHEQPQV